MALDQLRASLADSPVVNFGGYPYFVHPITDGIPLGRPEVLEEVVDAIVHLGRWAECDKIATAESMGFPLATGVSLRVRKPYVFFRKRSYGLPGEVSVAQVTGYSRANLFINNVHRGDRIVFLDDVISTGGTLRAVVSALRHLGAELADVIIVFEKTRDKGTLERELGVSIRTLLKVDVIEGRLVERS